MVADWRWRARTSVWLHIRVPMFSTVNAFPQARRIFPTELRPVGRIQRFATARHAVSVAFTQHGKLRGMAPDGTDFCVNVPELSRELGPKKAQK
jgi:hypothetical protein